MAEGGANRGEAATLTASELTCKTPSTQDLQEVLKTGVPIRSSGKLLYLLALVFLYLQLLVSHGSTPPPFSPPSSLSLPLTHTHTHTGEEEAKHDPKSYTRKESKVEDTVPPYQQLF